MTFDPAIWICRKLLSLGLLSSKHKRLLAWCQKGEICMRAKNIMIILRTWPNFYSKPLMIRLKTLNAKTETVLICFRAGTMLKKACSLWNFFRRIVLWVCGMFIAGPSKQIHDRCEDTLSILFTSSNPFCLTFVLSSSSTGSRRILALIDIVTSGNWKPRRLPLIFIGLDFSQDLSESP